MRGTDLTNRLLGSAVAATVAIASTLPATAFAADRYVLEDVEETRVEFGTGWYIRGDIGINVSGSLIKEDRNETIGGTDITKSDTTDTALSIGGAIGRRFSPDFRGELSFDYVASQMKNESQLLASAPLNSPCDGALRQVPGTDVNGNPVLFTSFIDTPCRQQDEASYNMQLIQAKGIYDLPNFGTLRPFIGAGLGLARVDYSTSVAGFRCLPDEFTTCADTGRSDGVRPTIGERFESEGQVYNGTSYHLAGTLLGGVSYQMSKNTALDLSYQYTKVMEGALLGAESPADATDFDTNQHGFKVGLRYDLW